MKTFDRAGDYVVAASNDPAQTAVPFQLAADALGVTRSAIEGRVRAGKLTPIKIENTRYVTLASVKAELDEFEREVAAVTRLLEAEAKKGTRTLPYNPVMGAIGRKTTTPHDRTVIGRILGEISRRSFKEDDFLLSAMVVRNQSGQPSPAFYDLAEELDRRYEDAETDRAYHEAQLDLIAKRYGHGA